MAVNSFDFGCLSSCVPLETGIIAPVTGEYIFKFKYLDRCVEVKASFNSGQELIIDLSTLNESYCFHFQIIDPNEDVLNVELDNTEYSSFIITTKVGCNKQTKTSFNTIPGASSNVIEQPTQHLVAKTATFDGALASDTALANEPKNGTDVPVFINGKKVVVGDGEKTNCSIYFSSDGGVTAKSFSNAHPNGKISVGDKLYINPTFHEYNLDALDTISVGGFISA